jgi:hypothetical protein
MHAGTLKEVALAFSFLKATPARGSMCGSTFQKTVTIVPQHVKCKTNDPIGRYFVSKFLVHMSYNFAHVTLFHTHTPGLLRSSISERLDRGTYFGTVPPEDRTRLAL